MTDLLAFLKDKNLPNAEKLADTLERFTDLTLDWNEKINLTAIRDRDEFIRKNVMDSLTLLGDPSLENASRVLDLGTGGGFPGMPLAIVCPDKQFVLMDSVGKKLKAVEAVASELGLTNVAVIHARAEDAAREPLFRESFDLVTSRAVAAMPVLSEYCIPFLKVGAFFAAYKTEASADEINSAARAVKLLGAEPAGTIASCVKEDSHIIVLYRKVKPTPSAYPRKAGMPSKLPL